VNDRYRPTIKLSSVFVKDGTIDADMVAVPNKVEPLNENQ
jgi:hypothetical protein